MQAEVEHLYEITRVVEYRRLIACFTRMQLDRLKGSQPKSDRSFQIHLFQHPDPIP